MHCTSGGNEVDWDLVCGAFENDGGAVDNLEKEFVMWDDAKDIQGVVDGFWPPLGTFSDNIPYDIRFGSKHPKIH